MPEKTISEHLEAAGFLHHPDRGTRADRRRAIVDKQGNIITRLRADEVMPWLREREENGGLVT